MRPLSGLDPSCSRGGSLCAGNGSCLCSLSGMFVFSAFVFRVLLCRWGVCVVFSVSSIGRLGC